MILALRDPGGDKLVEAFAPVMGAKVAELE